jgi:hypothetical protein
MVTAVGLVIRVKVFEVSVGVELVKTLLQQLLSESMLQSSKELTIVLSSVSSRATYQSKETHKL